MRYLTLRKIDAPDNLALVLNGYMKALMTLDQTAWPRETMHKYRQMLAEYNTPDLSAKPVSQACAQLFEWRSPRFYMLQVLDNSLHNWHQNIIWAIADLAKFFAEYDGDLKRYAIERRISCLDEDGGGDDSDWEHDGLDEDGEQKWKVVYKDDEASLASYSLAQDIAQYFVGDEDNDEKIGTSHAEDYNYFTSLVRREEEFSPFKMIAAFFGQEIPVYKQSDTGEMVEMSLGDKAESSLNKDITNARIIAWFELALKESNQAVFLQTFATTSYHYRDLLTQLERIRDLDFPEPEAYLHAE